MIRNTNDGSQRAPYLRTDINYGNVAGLPTTYGAPQGDERALHAAVKAAGYSGIQGGNPALCRELGLGVTTGGRVNKVGEAAPLAKAWREAGYACATLHVGWGMESDAELLRLAEDVIKASEAADLPLYIETHRATITQDQYRTVMMCRELPEVRINGDFSHWYTGLEMVYGDFNAKLDFIAPVFERVRFLHARIGNPGSIQVDIGDGTGRPYVDHFREIWTRAMMGFLRTAQPGDYLSFNPELLPPGIYYARQIKNAQGELVEEGDRWTQALLYTQIARECFAVAQERLKK